MKAIMSAFLLAVALPAFPDGRNAEAHEEPGRKTQGPVAGLPSQPGPHLEKIKSLGDNEWLALGPAAPDLRFGLAKGRAWSSKMVYAPDKRGAFLVGLGAHIPGTWFTRDGYYVDDLFFYDVNGHRWICCYPGTNKNTFVGQIKSGELKVREDGQLSDKSGRPVPYALVPHHVYQSHTYDTHLGKYATYWQSPGIGGDQNTNHVEPFAEGFKLLQEQLKGKTDRVRYTPFFYDVRTGEFERYPCDGFKPKAGVMNFTELFYYLPTRKAYWLFYMGETSLYDPATHQWSKLDSKGSPSPTGDYGACYDSKRDRIYVPARGATFTYDVKTFSWANTDKLAGAPPSTDANSACVHYDSANDRMIVVVFRLSGKDTSGKGVYVFDPETSKWSESPASLPAGLGPRGEPWNGFYSPELNAHFFHVAGDSVANGTVSVYRYKAIGKR